jgi:hypothetical protein
VTLAASLTRNLLRAADFLPFGYGFAIVSVLVRAGRQAAGRSRGGHTCRSRGARGAGSHPDRRAAGDSGAAAVKRGDQAASHRARRARAPRLTPERLDELASLAAAVSGDTGHSGPAVTRRVLGVAPVGAGPAMTTPLQFEELYERDWRELELLLARIASPGKVTAVSAAQVSGARVAFLYRRTCEHLALARGARLSRLHRRSARIASRRMPTN